LFMKFSVPYKDRSYSSLVQRGGRITLPPEIASFRLGQRVYFYARDGQVGFQARPKRAVRGRLLSSRIRRGIRSLAAYGPRTRAAIRQSGRR
jgi:hypothetical protein